MNSNPESESRNLLFPNQIPIPSSKISIPISNIKILNSYSESQILKFRSRNPEFKFKIPNPNSNFGIGIRSDSLGLKSRRSTSGDHGQYCKSWVMLLRTNRAVSVWNLLRLGHFFWNFLRPDRFGLKFSQAVLIPDCAVFRSDWAVFRAGEIFYNTHILLFKFWNNNFLRQFIRQQNCFLRDFEGLGKYSYLWNNVF